MFFQVIFDKTLGFLCGFKVLPSLVEAWNDVSLLILFVGRGRTA